MNKLGGYELGKVHQGDCLELMKQLPDKCVQTCVTSPPYWGLRDYGVKGQLGLEDTPEEYVEKMVEIFREVKRALKDDGTLWLNLGDSYNGSGGAGGDYNTGGIKDGQPKYNGRNVPTLKPKDLVGIPWRVAFALQADGWYLRQDIIWHKPNPMPESVKDRCSKAHEYIFLLSKNKKYYYDNVAIKEPVADTTIARQRGGVSKQHKNTNGAPGQPKHTLSQYRCNDKNRKVNLTRNKRSVWTVSASTKPLKEAHFAVYPPDLIEPCVLAGCPKNGIVLDPFAGSGTTGTVAVKNKRCFIGFELNNEYCNLANDRIQATEKGLTLNEYKNGQESLFDMEAR